VTNLGGKMKRVSYSFLSQIPDEMKRYPDGLNKKTWTSQQMMKI
jgi:hypothetical protein